MALIGNRFAFGHDEEYEAIVDRGHLIYFDPTPVEVHVNVGQWFWDQEIYDFIGERLHLMDSLSSRTYLKTWERKKAGGDWRKLVEERFCHDTALLLVQKLEISDKTVEERAKDFITHTGLSRAIYFNYKKQLESDGQIREIKRQDVPTTVLCGSPPLELDLAEEVAAAKAETEQMAPNQDTSEEQTQDAELRVFGTGRQPPRERDAVEDSCLEHGAVQDDRHHGRIGTAIVGRAAVGDPTHPRFEGQGVAGRQSATDAG